MTIIELSRIAVRGYIIFLITIKSEVLMGVLLHFFIIIRAPTASVLTLNYFQLLYLIENYLCRGQDRDFLEYVLLTKIEVFSV